MIDFYALKIGDRIVYVCSYCEALVNLVETHRQYHEDAEPGPDAADSDDYNEEFGPLLENALSVLIQGEDMAEFVPLTQRYRIARRILNAGWRPTRDQ